MASTCASVPGSHSFDVTVHGHGQAVPAKDHNTVSGARSMLTVGMGHDTVAPPGAPTNAFARTALHSMDTKFATHPADTVSGNAALGKVTLLGASGKFTPGGATGFVRQVRPVERLSPTVGHDTMLGSQRVDALGFLKAPHTPTGLVADFVSGQDKVHLQASSLESLKSRSDASVSSHGGNTYISLHGGKTTIELHGIAHLQPPGIDPHRH